MKKYFGTDGIRGKAYKVITLDLAYKVGRSLKSSLNINEVVIGQDTRESSMDIVNAIARGARDSGMKVYISEVISTPGLAYYSLIKNILGVMITASHNPYEDNGIKIFNSGKKLNKIEEKKVEEFLNSDEELEKEEGSIETITIYSHYDKLIDSLDIPKTNKKIGIDLANGSNYSIGKMVISKFCDNLKVVGDKPNGKNINDKVGATYTSTIASLVKDNNLDIGFSYDGDGDRLMVCDSEGTVYDGDLIIYVIAKYMYEKGILKNNIVAFTKMTNLAIINNLKSLGLDVKITDIGDKYILRELIASDGIVGGENCGHIILRNILPSGDGVITSCYLLKILEETGKTLKELTSEITMYPDKLVNLEVKDKSIINDKSILDKVEEIKELFKDEGKVLVRASGTQDLVRVSVSHKSKDLMEKYINLLVDMVKELDK